MRIVDFYRFSLMLCFGAWLLFCAVNALTGGSLGGEPFTVFMSRIWSNVANVALLVDILAFFGAQLLCVLVWAILVAWGALGLAHLRPALKAEQAVGWSFGLSLMLLVVANSVLYPLSTFALPIPSALVGHVMIGIFAVAFAVLVVFGCVRERHVQAGAGVTVLLMAVALFGTGAGHAPETSGPAKKPNVIVIGIDALRPDMTGFFGYQPSPTPNLDYLLSNAHVYSNTYTPVARTYAAWISMLTGQYPVEHGARFNLMVEDYVDKEALITDSIRDAGYTTLWALDERHFNYIDKSYGFDKVVGPKIGAADLLVAVFSDNPIVNLVSNTRMGEVLFPYVSGNRGNFVTYNPYLFNDEIASAVKSSKKPVFLAAHLCLPHFPFVSNLMPEISDEMAHGIDSAHYRRYLSMLKLVDQQLADLVNRLSAAGVLDNAVVYLLSDHGEGLGLRRDMFESGVMGASFEMNLYGHGTSVLTPSQFRVLLARMRFRDGRLLPEGRVDSSLRSLVDLAPDIAETISLEGPFEFQGVPLAKVEPDRTVYMESSFTTAAMNEERLDILRAISEAADFYAVNEQGRLYLIPEAYDELLKAKQRAAVSGNTLVAVYPDETENVLVMDLKEKKWWPSEALDVIGGGPDWRPILGKLCDLYDEENFLDHGFCDDIAAE